MFETLVSPAQWSMCAAKRFIENKSFGPMIHLVTFVNASRKDKQSSTNCSCVL